MTTPEGMTAFTAAYNAGLLARRSAQSFSMPEPHFLGSSEQRSPAQKKERKKNRKQAEAARKRNRKRK